VSPLARGDDIGGTLGSWPPEQVSSGRFIGHEQPPHSYSIAARPALEALEAELPPEQLAAARHAAAATSLDDLVDRALAVTAPK